MMCFAVLILSLCFLLSPISLTVAKCWDPSPRSYFTIPRGETLGTKLHISRVIAVHNDIMLINNDMYLCCLVDSYPKCLTIPCLLTFLAWVIPVGVYSIRYYTEMTPLIVKGIA